MRSRRGSILITVGIFLSLLTGVLVFRLVRQTTPPPGAAGVPTATPIETRPVPAAARPLSAGTALTTTDIVERQYPADLVPVGVLTDTSKLVGQVVAEAVQQGEFFRSAQLRGVGRPLSEELEKTKVAIAFPIDALLRQSRTINAGDRLDLLLTLDVTEVTAEGTLAGRSTSITLQNIKVLRVVGDPPSEQNPNPEAQGLLFEMTPQEALIAKHVKDSGGVMDFALRSPQDTQPFTAESINQDFLLDLYRFRAPRSGSGSSQP